MQNIIVIATVWCALALHFCISAPATTGWDDATTTITDHRQYRSYEDYVYGEGEEGGIVENAPNDSSSTISSHLILSAATGQFVAITKSGRVSGNNPIGKRAESEYVLLLHNVLCNPSVPCRSARQPVLHSPPRAQRQRAPGHKVGEIQRQKLVPYDQFEREISWRYSNEWKRGVRSGARFQRRLLCSKSRLPAEHDTPNEQHDAEWLKRERKLYSLRFRGGIGCRIRIETREWKCNHDTSPRGV